MAPSDITAILASLTDLGTRMNIVVEKLARIDERTLVLTDHEIRIRAAEDAAKDALNAAKEARRVADRHEVRITAVERVQNDLGKFTLGTFGKVVSWVVGVAVAVLSLAAYVHNW